MRNRSLVETMNKKNKGANVKPFMVKQYLSVFINCMIENPAFESQARTASRLSYKPALDDGASLLFILMRGHHGTAHDQAFPVACTFLHTIGRLARQLCHMHHVMLHCKGWHTSAGATS